MEQMTTKTTAEQLNGLAFPTAIVTYGASGYSATIKRDDDVYRARVPYRHAIGIGPANAVRAALKAYEKLQADHPGIEDVSSVVPVGGDIDRKRYSFTFVPVEYFAG